MEMSYKQNTNGFIYFIKDTGNNKIKIGWTKDVNRNLKNLQRGNPNKLILLGYVKGFLQEEKNIHSFKFNEYKVKGTNEWYWPSKSILDFISSTLEHGKVIENKPSFLNDPFDRKNIFTGIGKYMMESQIHSLQERR